MTIESESASIAMPLYRQIKTEIKHFINTGILKDGDKIPSVNDITQKYGVSAVTAVRVFKELKKENYARHERGKGYFVSQNAGENYRRKLQGVIGCIIRPYRQVTIYDNYFNEINAGIQNECMKCNFDTLYPDFCFDLQNQNLTPQTIAKLEQDILPIAERVDGLLLDERIPESVLEKIVCKLNIPHVLLFRQSKVPKVKFLVPAFDSGAKKAIEFAVKGGYKNFIFCNYGMHPTVNSAINSAQGRLQELKNKDPRICSIFIDNCFEKDSDIIAKIMSAYNEFKTNQMKSFIFCSTDSISRYICDEMTNKGINFGSDCGLLGVGGTGYSTMKKPEIASVDTKPFEFGQMAAKAIFQEIGQEPVDVINKFIPTFELKLGNTF